MRRLTQEEFLHRAHELYGDKYDYSECHFVNTRTKVRIICPKHGVFEQVACSHLMGHGCRHCGNEEAWSEDVKEERKKKAFTPERLAKMEATCMERYGAKTFALSKEGRSKIDAIKSTSEFRNRMRDIISSDDVQGKTKATCRRRYGVDSFMQTDDGRKLMHLVMTREGVMDKIIQKKKQNGTVNTSKAEDRLYVLLCEQFGCDDVLRQYCSDVYPFYCDFYIKSLDLYIEHNVCWTHGGHWFDDSCVSDNNKVSLWKSKNSRYYSNALDTWTIRDVAKRNTAKNNNLNYVVFWKANLFDVNDWILSGCPIRKDWE